MRYFEHLFATGEKWLVNRCLQYRLIKLSTNTFSQVIFRQQSTTRAFYGYQLTSTCPNPVLLRIHV